MATKINLLIFFGLFAAFGSFWSVRSIRKMRAPRKYRNLLFAWTERPLSGFKYEQDSWLATLIHRIAVTTLGLVVLGMLALHPFSEIDIPGSPAPAATLLVGPALFASISFIGFLWGSTLFGPIAKSIGGEGHFATSTEGILYAGHLFPWSAFSHFSFDVEQRVVRIWSASFPGVVGFALAPPSPENMSKLVGVLQSHLPTESMVSSPILFMKYAFPVCIASVSVPVVVIAYLTFRSPLAIALIANGLLMYILVFLGSKLIMHFAYGGRAKPALIE